MTEAEKKAREVAEAFAVILEAKGCAVNRAPFLAAFASMVLQLRRDTIEECARVADDLAEQADRDHGKPMRTWGSGVMSGRCSAYRNSASAIRKLAQDS